MDFRAAYMTGYARRVNVETTDEIAKRFGHLGAYNLDVAQIIQNSDRRPLSARAFFLGVTFSLLPFMASVLFEIIHDGNPDAVYVVFVLPILWLFTTVVAAPIFFMIRKRLPSALPWRLVLMLFIITPVTVFVWLCCASIVEQIIDSQHVSSFYAAFAAFFADSGRFLLLSGVVGAFVSWGTDCLIGGLSSESATERKRAKRILCSAFVFLMSPFVFFVFCNQYVVSYSAQKIAGSRPYCILVPHGETYVAATRLWQLSPFKMQASYILVTGSRGGFYVTNHAVLLLESPREYWNWSYHNEAFVHESRWNLLSSNEALTNSTTLQETECVPVVDFARKL